MEISSGHGRPRPPSCARVVTLRFPADFLKATVFVGIETNGRFIPTGTGFLIGIDYRNYKWIFLATADHVVKDIRGDYIWVRMNRNGGGCSTVAIEKKKQFPQLDVANDIAMFGMLYDTNLFSQLAILIGRELYNKDREEIWNHDIGDEVATIGLYTTHYGQSRNLPVVRIGHISLMPGEPVFSHRGYVQAYLIEMKSIAGLSGSPVYVNVPLVRVKEGQMQHLKKETAIPLGMLTGYHLLQSAEDQIIVPQYDGDEILASEKDSADSRNTGFGVVVPWERLLEMTETPWLKADMDNAIANLIRNSGTVPAGIKLTTTSVPSGNATRPP
jgi:hypothetical protein